MTDNGEKQRWTDKPLARIMIGLLTTAAATGVAGATWVVKSVVDDKSLNTRQDGEISTLRMMQEQETKAREVQQAEVMKRLDEIRDDVKELRKK